ncbi:MAG: restriction endonuclease subunit S, partial [Candidatus Dormibacteraceae bacterium]
MSAGSRWPALPENWKATKLKRVASLRAGEAIASEAVAAYGEYPVFGGNGIRGYTTSYTHDGTFALVGRQGALCGNVNYASGRFWASEHAVVVMPMEGSDIFWLGELLRAMDLNQYSQSAAQPGLSVEMVEQLEIPVPPRATQRAIAEYLSRETARIDDLIAAEQSRACLAEEWELSKTQSLVLGREDSLARVNRPEGPLSPVPGGWGFHRNKTFLAEVTDLSESGNEELLTVSHITGVTSRAEKDVNMFLAESNEGYKRVAPDDLVINT